MLANCGLEIGLSPEADPFLNYFPVLVNKKGSRNGVDVPIRVGDVVAVYDDLISKPVLLREIRNHIADVVTPVLGNANNEKSIEANCLLTASMSGSSSLQGPHDVAQKLMRTVLPFKEPRDTF